MTRYRDESLRKGRVSEVGRIYLVTTVTHARKSLFRDLSNGRLIVRAMRHRHVNHVVESLAYVVIPDHLHWLFGLCAGQRFSEVMRSFKSYIARRIKRLNGPVAGPVWQAGYHDRAVQESEELRQLARYVVANPLRAGLAGNIGDYSLWDAVWL